MISQNGVIPAMWMGSNDAVMPYVTCGSKNVACSAAMMNSTSPSM